MRADIPEPLAKNFIRSNIMKKTATIVFSTFLMSAGATDSQDARDALQLINHVNCAVAEITESKDPIVLEREYNALTVDSLKLDSIKDEETIIAIKSLMRMASKMRITATEREMLKEEIEAEMNDAIYSSMPNIGTLASPNLISTAVNLTVGAASAYVNYEKQKKAIQRRAKKEEWNLNKEDIKTLEDLNEDLLDSHWSIIKNYRINDYKRVTARDIKSIIEHFRDPDLKRRWAFFRLHTEDYKYLTRFWYYRSVAADSVGETAESERSLDEYQKLHLQITRRDKIAALVAMQKIRFLLDRRFSASDIRKQLGIVERNAEHEDWNLYYFCGIIYADKLNDVASAKRCLEKAITELSFRLDKRLKDFNGKLDSGDFKPKDHDKIPSAESLMACRMKMQMIEKNQLHDQSTKKVMLEIIGKENSMMLDAVHYIGRTKDADVAKALLPKITTISVESGTRWGRDDAFLVLVPVEWFEAGKIAPRLRFGNDSDGGFVVDEQKRELVKLEPGNVYSTTQIALTLGSTIVSTPVSLPCAIVGSAMYKNYILYYESRQGPYVRLTYRTEIDKLDDELQDVVFEMPHKYCDVKIIFTLPRDGKNEHTSGFAVPKAVVIDGTIFGLKAEELKAE